MSFVSFGELVVAILPKKIDLCLLMYMYIFTEAYLRTKLYYRYLATYGIHTHKPV